MHALRGSCHCGNVRVDMALPQAPDQYSPRACDCDFCSKHGASYLSDPDGALVIRVKDGQLLRKYRQGSGTADMLVCGNCGVLAGAMHRAEGRIYATVNARMIEGNPTFAETRPVSPRTLSAEQKAGRWKTLWFADVTLKL